MKSKYMVAIGVLAAVFAVSWYVRGLGEPLKDEAVPAHNSRERAAQVAKSEEKQPLAAATHSGGVTLPVVPLPAAPAITTQAGVRTDLAGILATSRVRAL